MRKEEFRLLQSFFPQTKTLLNQQGLHSVTLQISLRDMCGEMRDKFRYGYLAQRPTFQLHLENFE